MRIKNRTKLIDDLVNILEALYIFNHGDKVCTPIEFSFKTGCKQNDGGDYYLFEQKLQQLGYKVDNISFIKKNYRLQAQVEEFQERKKSKSFYPFEVKHFTVSNEEGLKFDLFETPITLEFLAMSGNKNAIGTYNNCKQKEENNKTLKKKK